MNQKSAYLNALIQDYLNRIAIPKLTKKQSQKCEGEITEKELLKALKKTQNKSPGKDGIKIYHKNWKIIEIVKNATQLKAKFRLLKL